MNRSHAALRVLVATALLGFAPAGANAIAVDSLVNLSVDVSGSTDRAEFELMINGIADAFDSPGVQNAIANGPNGRIGVTLYMWSSAGQEQDIFWTEVMAGTAAAFANTVRSLLDPVTSITFLGTSAGDVTVNSSDFGFMQWLEPFTLTLTDDGMGGLGFNLSGGTGDGNGFTAVSDAIDFGVGLFGQAHGFTSMRSVIDITGDGYENFDFDPAGCSSPPGMGCQNLGNVFGMLAGSDIFDPDTYFTFTAASRDAAAAAGVIINGLPILTDVSDLDTFYANQVITGAGAFVQPAASFSDFATAFQTKLTQEIVPEPGIVLLLGIGLGALGLRSRRSA